MSEPRNYITVINLTKSLSREMRLYALDDLRFATPIPIMQAVWTIIFALVWTYPFYKITGIHMTVVWLLLAIGPPFLMGWVITKDLFNGRTLIQLLWTSITFLLEPRNYAGIYEARDIGVYRWEFDVWVSRRKEIEFLKALRAITDNHGESKADVYRENEMVEKETVGT